MGKKGTGPGRRKSTMGTHPRKDEYLDTPTAATSSKASSKGGRWNVGKQQRVRPGYIVFDDTGRVPTAWLDALAWLLCLYLDMQGTHNL